MRRRYNKMCAHRERTSVNNSKGARRKNRKHDVKTKKITTTTTWTTARIEWKTFEASNSLSTLIAEPISECLIGFIIRDVFAQSNGGAEQETRNRRRRTGARGRQRQRESAREKKREKKQQARREHRSQMNTTSVFMSMFFFNLAS